jgi:hypothetical protein
MGVTCGAEADIQLAVEKVKAVLSILKKTRSATEAKMTEPLLVAQAVPKVGL